MPDPVSCSICQLESARYTCPACGVRTCSSRCIVEHKVAQKCSGQRDKTAFVAREQYGYLNLMEDYRFLEEMSRKIADSKREAPRWPKRRKVTGSSRKLPSQDPLLPLKRAAVSSGIKLVTLADGMERRKHNKTRLVRSGKEAHLEWTITWSFRAAASSKSPLSLPPVQHKTPRNSALATLPELLLRLSLKAQLSGPVKAMLDSSVLVSTLEASGEQGSLVFLLAVPTSAEAPTRSARGVLDRISSRPAPLPQINKTYEPLPQHRRRMIGSLTPHSSLPNKPGVYQPGSHLFASAAHDTVVAPAASAQKLPAEVSDRQTGIAAARRYWRLSNSRPLGTALTGCTIIEWPEIEIWKRQDFEKACRLGYIEVVHRISEDIPPPPRISPAPTRRAGQSLPGLAEYGTDSDTGAEEGEVG